MSADEREFLLRSLRDLDAERDAGDIDAADYDELRDDYTARAAAVLRGTESASPRPRRRWLVLGAIATVAVVAGLLVATTSGQRLPNGPATGSIDASTAERLDLARQYIADGKAVEALKTYDQILKVNPRHPEALAYRGWLVRLAGLPDDGLKYIDRAIAADPSYPDAHFFRAMVLWKDHKDPAGAIPEFRQFLASNPPSDRAAAVQQALEQAEAELAAQGT
ncbi:MAG TPA: tetratricopeptide repeat protein [Acidimicrobiales bacterium]|nr:tetratricopeptide repeat protein [Acidimicrobiales bacterium]